MKGILNFILIGVLVFIIFNVFQNVFVTRTDKLVPDSYKEVKLINVIDSNTIKVEYLNDEKNVGPFIIKTILTNNNEDAQDFINKELKSADNIYLEEDGYHVDDYDNPEVWIWYFKGNDEYLLQEELSKNNLIGPYKQYADSLMHTKRVKK